MTIQTVWEYYVEYIFQNAFYYINISQSNTKHTWRRQPRNEILSLYVVSDGPAVVSSGPPWCEALSFVFPDPGGPPGLDPGVSQNLGFWH